MSNYKICLVWLTVFTLSFLLITTDGKSEYYSVKARVNLRSGPGTNYSSIGILNHNRTLVLLSKKGGWSKVKTVSGAEGFIRSDLISGRWIKVHKKERKLYVMREDMVIQTYSVALCPGNPLGDKVKLGDGGTPEGRFFICEMIRNPKKPKYGARSLRISYPNIEDARRGLGSGLIDYPTYMGIVKQIRAGRIPNQGTPLGGSIRIHGGGVKNDWTLGCVALDDGDVIKLFENAGLGTRVEIYKSADSDKKLNTPGYLNALILEGAKNQLKSPSLYTSNATGMIQLNYPFGDIRTDQAVCTDIIIRAVRNAGIDLQALIHEDAVLNPGRYKEWIKKPNYHIDHRRSRNLRNFFIHAGEVLPNEITSENRIRFLPGDIVVMDTGIRNGTVFDHIGILDSSVDDQNYPKVINIWTIEYRTAAMDLLGNGYPDVVGHFRMTHPFDYF